MLLCDAQQFLKLQFETYVKNEQKTVIEQVHNTFSVTGFNPLILTPVHNGKINEMIYEFLWKCQFDVI